MARKPQAHARNIEAFEKSPKGILTRKRYNYTKALANKFKSKVKRDMKMGAAFEDAMDSAKKVIKTEMAAMSMEQSRIDSVVDAEYARIMRNYENRVSNHG